MSNRFRHTQARASLKQESSVTYKQHAIRWLKNDGWAVVGTIIMLIVAVWYFGFFSGRFVISDVEIHGSQFISQDDIRGAVDGYMNKKSIGIISHNTYWTFKPEAVEKAVTEAFQESFAFENVQVEKKLPNKAIISVEERIPSVTWITTGGSNESLYTVDREGVVASIVEGRDQADPSFPRIEDPNREYFDLGWQVVSPEYIDYVLHVHDALPEQLHVNIDSYIFPDLDCTERQFIAEKIFEQDDIEVSEEYVNRQREIQEQFQEGLLTIDESLALLEDLKREELTPDGDSSESDDSDNENASLERTEWSAVHVPTECDFVVVGHELRVVLNEDAGGFQVYMDTQVDLQEQLDALQVILQQVDAQAIEYIDVRIPGRVYYK